jgi:hypothetical protein
MRTLLLVPVLYTIVIKDLKLIRWDKPAPQPDVATPVEHGEQ